MRIAGGSSGLAESFTQEMVARYGFDGDEQTRMRLLQGSSQALFIDALGVLCNLL